MLALYSVTMFCWFWVPVPAALMPTWNERFCQKISLYRIGFEKPGRPAGPVQPGWPAGQVTVSPLMAAVRSEEFRVLVKPADCGHDALFAVPVELVVVQFPAGALADGVPILLVITPEEARVSLCATVLLMMFTFNESCNDIPAPSQPAMLFTMMLLVMLTLFQRSGRGTHGGVVGAVGHEKVATSVPFTCWRRMPPPLPLSAELP